MFESGARKVKPPETGPLLPAPQRLARQKKAKLRTTDIGVMGVYHVVVIEGGTWALIGYVLFAATDGNNKGSERFSA